MSLSGGRLRGRKKGVGLGLSVGVVQEKSNRLDERTQLSGGIGKKSEGRIGKAWRDRGFRYLGSGDSWGGDL